jgi:exopolysaccharide biosynthesis polyprenyl glycosylphosphotransferase
LLALAGWDSLMGVCAYTVLYRLRMGSWWGQNWQAAGLILGWVTLSYLLGRYSKASLQEPLRKPWRSQTIQVAVLLLAGVQIHSWLFRVLMEATRFRGFLVPFIGFVAVGSLTGQAWLRKRVRKYPGPWIIVANEKEFTVVEQELKQEVIYGNPDKEIRFSRFTEDLVKELAQKKHTGVAVSHTMLQDKKTLRILVEERQEGVECCSLEDWCENQLQRLPPELLDTRSLLVADGYQLKPGTLNWRIKRFGDVSVAAILVILTSPLVVIGMAAIKLEDGGPCFYKQRRTGLYGQELWIKKLRSMSVDAERTGVQWAQANDPRITRCGRWLRKFRIDELPQLWSVLVGEMSLIGPRPERPELEEKLEGRLQNYHLRHWLRPGLSGWAQVCYPYGASEEDSRNKLSYDLYYLRNANLFLDILILFKTIRLVAGGQGTAPLGQAKTTEQIYEEKGVTKKADVADNHTTKTLPVQDQMDPSHDDEIQPGPKKAFSNDD